MRCCVGSIVLALTIGGCPDVGLSLPEWGSEKLEQVFGPTAPPKRIFAKRFIAPVFEEPRDDAKRIGYLRAGTVVLATTDKAVGYEGCEDGWFQLDTVGYVCNGLHVIAFTGEKLPELRATQADLESKLPYRYATVREPTPEFRRLPTIEELEALAATADAAAEGQTEATMEPNASNIVRRILQPGFYVSLDRQFNKQERVYWRTQHNGFVLADALRGREGSHLRGQELDASGTLPVAIVRKKNAPVFKRDASHLLSSPKKAERRSLLFVGGEERFYESSYVRTLSGAYLRRSDVTLVTAQQPPSEVGRGERWIDIDLDEQTLVAYEGVDPAYVTLISSGRVRREGDLSPSHPTPPGLYRIRAKHLTSTMDGNSEFEEPYSLDDVPYVMYFHGAYAFHSAFWHDRFGRPKSHGCINLAPHDARWLYNWAGPDAPESWHGVYATEDNPGTWVRVRGQTPVW